MVHGNFISLTIYTIIVFLAAIFTGNIVLFILSIVNIILLVYQYDKAKNKIEEQNKKEEQLTDKEMKRNQIKELARKNIENKYENFNLSEQEKKDLIRDEFIRLMIEKE